MSKIVRVSNSDYKLSVQSGGTITLDTGARVGTTIITGSLDVMGTLTYLDTQNTQITDNIIVLNKGEANSYVTQQYAGIEIDRGSNVSYGNARIVYDEKTNIDGDGTIAFKYTVGGTYIPLETNKITSYGDLILYPGSTTGVVTVTGTSNYEARVIDDDTLTNKKYVDDKIVSYLASASIPAIISGDSRVEVLDDSVSGLTSIISLYLNNALKATLTPSGFTVDGYLTLNSDVSSVYINNSNATLPLKFSSANGRVEIANYMQLDNQTTTPSATSAGSLIYAKSSEGAGRTGLYFVNNTPNADELVSKNRALLWSMIF